MGGGGGGCGWCREMCVEAAEQLDCNGPDSQACLDSVCPSKQVSHIYILTVFVVAASLQLRILTHVQYYSNESVYNTF